MSCFLNKSHVECTEAKLPSLWIVSKVGNEHKPTIRYSQWLFVKWILCLLIWHGVAVMTNCHRNLRLHFGDKMSVRVFYIFHGFLTMNKKQKSLWDYTKKHFNHAHQFVINHINATSKMFNNTKHYNRLTKQEKTICSYCSSELYKAMVVAFPRVSFTL